VDDAGGLRRLVDRAEITDVVIRFARAMDIQDWELLRSCLAEHLDVDYSALRGDPPSRISAEEYVAARVKGLHGLRTQHISTNHLVSVDGDSAECVSCYLIHRLDPARRDGENTFDSAGHYTHGLRRTADGWRIDTIAQTVLWSRGNPDVHGALRRTGTGR
jgi:ketosteroid isomerase-like protein